ncbi:MAG TPA: DUF1572 domain-containing protein [Bacteroidia bacterium]|nr:DUF1572 domain-containing protein [Bacteroidia bacterium]
MNKCTALAIRLREVYIDGKWIANTNYKEQLDGIGWPLVNENISGLNSIALLTFHINYYLEGLLKVLNGGNLEISDKYSFDMPQINNEEEWLEMKSQFLTNASEFCNKIEQLDDVILDCDFTDKKYGSYLRNIEAVIEHSYYHLGQIVLIKKLINFKSVNP